MLMLTFCQPCRQPQPSPTTLPPPLYRPSSGLNRSCWSSAFWTLIYRADTNELLRNVPGIRHRAEANGDFHFRIATPRIAFGDKDTRVRYEIHAQVVTPNSKGPETIVNLYSE